MSDIWKLVPVQPTEEMIRAVLDSGLYHDGENAARAVLIDEYKTMIGAAPAAQQGVPVAQEPWARVVDVNEGTEYKPAWKLCFGDERYGNGFTHTALYTGEQLAAVRDAAQSAQPLVREAMSEEKISIELEAHQSRFRPNGIDFRRGVRFAERIHGIGASPTATPTEGQS